MKIRKMRLDSSGFVEFLKKLHDLPARFGDELVTVDDTIPATAKIVFPIYVEILLQDESFEDVESIEDAGYLDPLFTVFRQERTNNVDQE